MRLSRLNIKKINLNDIDKNYSGQDILMKLGELYQYESGIYGYGNLWTKLERIVENIIIEELDKVGCIQVEFPKLQPKKLWEQSNRWDMYTKEGDIMFLFDISNPLTLLLMLAVTVLLIFLAQEVKRSSIGAIALFAYLILLVIHVAQIATLPEPDIIAVLPST